jgi:hypothetical protein
LHEAAIEQQACQSLDDCSWAVFVAFLGDGTELARPTDDGRRKLTTNVIAVSRSRLGMWQFYALGFFGNDVGIDRANTVTQGGVGARWLP